METYFEITCTLPKELAHQSEDLSQYILSSYQCDGVEEFNLDEPMVDEILGERSYSGGDLPQEVLDEVESTHFNFESTTQESKIKFFFYGDGCLERASLCFNEISIENPDIEFCLSEKEVIDWNQTWKQHYEPILVNNFLEIIPSFSKDYTSKAQNFVYIEPGMGFGTGSHETTYLCLKIYSELNDKSKNILDFGCGSGILGISANKMNPETQIDLYDIDPNALENARYNLEINQLQKSLFNFFLPEQRKNLKPKYELIFANILLPVLLEETSYFANHLNTGGHLILSGILNEQVKELVEHYQKLNQFEVIITTSLKDWSAVLLKKK